jgi:hypothetical protein
MTSVSRGSLNEGDESLRGDDPGLRPDPTPPFGGVLGLLWVVWSLRAALVVRGVLFPGALLARKLKYRGPISSFMRG